MAVQISSSPASADMLGPKAISALSDGTLIACWWDVSTGTWNFSYSTNDGTSWSAGTVSSGVAGATVGNPSPGLFIDTEDRIWVAIPNGDGGTTITSGTFSTDTITFDTGIDITTTTEEESDISAWYDGTDWYAVWIIEDSGADATWGVVKRTSGGTYSEHDAASAWAPAAACTQVRVLLKHNGDGKTPRNPSAPDFKMVYLNNNDGVYVADLTFSSGPSWTLGSATNVYSNVDQYGYDEMGMDYDAFNDLWYFAVVDDVNSPYVVLVELDGTTATALTSGAPEEFDQERVQSVDCVVDQSNGDVYLFGGSSTSLHSYAKYTPGTGWGSVTTVEAIDADYPRASYIYETDQLVSVYMRAASAYDYRFHEVATLSAPRLILPDTGGTGFGITLA